MCISNYWLGTLAFLAGLISLVNKKKIALAVWCFAACIGYIMLLGITYSDMNGEILLFYIESEWQSLGVIIAAPFVFSLLSKLKFNHAILVLALAFTTRLIYIYVANEQFSWRYRFTNKILIQMKKKHIYKLGLIHDEKLEKKLLIVWGLPDESMLISAMHGDNPQLTFGFVDTGDVSLMKRLANPKNISTSFEIAIPSSWNYEYFRPDTVEPYKILTVEELFQ